MGKSLFTSPLHQRLRNLSLFRPQDEARLDALLADTSSYAGSTTLQEEKSECRLLRVLLSGWGVRYKSLPDGERQITNFLLPGDTMGLYGALFSSCESGIELLTDAVVAELPCTRLFDIFEQSARFGASLCWLAGQDERFLEQQVVRIGQMNACTRIAHLLLELNRRLRLSGAREGEARTFPITQVLIAQSLGMSHVHANRSCGKLQRQDLIHTGVGSIELLDLNGLARLCDFDDDYIQDTGPDPGDCRRPA